MSKLYKEQWERLFQQKRQELLENDCDRALSISSFDDLQTALRELTSIYGQGRYPDLISFLNPSLNHLRSFTAAITSASQYHSDSTLIWGAIQALVLAICQTSAALENMLGIVVELNETLPQFGSYLKMFPGSPALQFYLQDLYDDYMDYCITSIQYMKRSASANFLRYFLSSNPQQALKRTKENMQKHIKSFRREAELVHRQHTWKQHQEIQQKLTTDPLTKVPKSNAPLAFNEETPFPITTVNLYRNYTFLGRDEVLEEMYTSLNPSNNTIDANVAQQEIAENKHGHTPPCCVLTGLGGIGKSQAALEFSYKHREEYDAIFWIHSEQDSSLSSTYATIAEKLGLMKEENEHDGQHQSRLVTSAQEWLRKTARKWLLIFDNVEDIDDLNPYFPLDIHSQSSIILTTQKASIFPITEEFTTIKIPNFEREDGARLLFKYLRRLPLDDEEEEAARKISDLLDGLPLALATIGGYINQSDSSVPDYLENLRTSSHAWEAGAIGPVKQYEKTLKTVFDIALRELPENARCLLDSLAFLNPDNIPEDIFTGNIGRSKVKFLYSKAELTDVIRILRQRQLISRNTSGTVAFLSIHRTVQWAVLYNLSQDYSNRWQAFQRTFDLLRRGMPVTSPIDNPDQEKWAEFEKYVPQILNLRTHCLWPEPPVDLPEDFAQVLSDLATYMWHAGIIQDGNEALKTAEHILDDHDVGEKDPLRSNVHEHIGIFASFNGVSERGEAMERRYKALVSRKAAFDEMPKNSITLADKIRRYNVVSDMAFGHLQCENFEEVQNCIQECHAQYVTWGDEDEIPFEYTKYYHTMSYVHMSQQHPIDAIQACKQASILAEKAAGLMHPVTQLVRFSLGNHLYLAGELDASYQENEAVLRARSKICGEFNHFTLESYSMCAKLLTERQDLQEAARLFEKCLERRKRSAWNEEGVARAQYLYSQTLDQLGRNEEATKLLQAARKTRERFLKTYPQWLTPNEADELVVFDQMVSMWAGRYTGRLRQRSGVGFGEC